LGIKKVAYVLNDGFACLRVVALWEWETHLLFDQELFIID